MTRLCQHLAFASLSTVFVVYPATPVVVAEQRSGEPCSATLSVTQYSDYVPAYVGWEALFEDVAAKRVSPRAMGLAADEDRLTAAAALAAQQTANIRSAKGLSGAPSEAAAVAAAVLTQRDDLFRTAQPETVAALSAATRGLAQTATIDLGAQGRTVETPGGPRCVLTVDGRVYPHLLPEGEVWRNYFTSYERMVQRDDVKDAAGQYRTAFLSTLRNSRLNLPRPIQLVVLQTAERTMAAVRQAERAGALNNEITRLVLNARTSLLRSISQTEWIEVQRDVASIREGSFFRFPVDY
jgi:hypothetical protein